MLDTEEREAEENKFLQSWLIRPCWVYADEYKECSCWKARFHQYFIHGKLIDCSNWNKDYTNCLIWDKDKSEDAYNALIESETVRRRERLVPHFTNTVWKNRDKPPENWNAPLPEWMQTRLKKSLLSKLTEENPKQSDNYCSIM